MARPVEIDRTHALRKAAELFWQRGYRATSLSDLMAATAMGKGSFYAAFGSKESLFRASLDWYHARSTAAGQRISANHTGLAALQAFIDNTLIELPAERRRRGCLLVNAVVELEDAEPELHKAANRYLQLLERRCAAYLLEASNQGELQPGLDPATLPGLTATLLQGLRVDARMGRSRRVLRERVTAFLTLIASNHEQQTARVPT